jgi:hypothetical protein
LGRGIGDTSGARANGFRSRVVGVSSTIDAGFGDNELGGESTELWTGGFSCGGSTVDVIVRSYNRSVEEQPKIPGIARESANITLIARIAKNQRIAGRYSNSLDCASANAKKFLARRIFPRQIGVKDA